ncbi:MAG: peptidoglycan-binding protein [Patescibacteria group bacterium]
MTKTRIARIAALTAGSVAALGFAFSASAMTVAELQAAIASLSQQLAAMQGGSSASVTFTRDLTVGSKGADVTALQNWLIGKGYSIPAGATGYFGAQTRSAVAAWQAAAGISPAAGYFGPKSRASVGGAVVVVPGGTTTGGVTTGTGSTGGITTPGAEGTLTVTAGTVSNTTVYSGSTMAPVLAFKAKALNSDIAIQRVKVGLGTTSAIYNKVYSKIYLVDEAGTVVASADLNSNTVVKDTDNVYYITLSGFSSVVPKDTTKNFTVKVDARNVSTGSTDLGSHTVTLPINGVRGIDGAGIDQYSPAVAISQAATLAATLADSATLTVATAAATPLTQEVVAANGAALNEADKVALLSFDVRATNDNVLVTDVMATVSSVGSATASSTYLYVGNTLVGSSSVSGTTHTFADVNYTVPKGSAVTFTLKADVRSAATTATNFTASIPSGTSGILAENTAGDSVTATGSATSNTITVRKVGPVFSLNGTPTIVKSATASQNNTSTSTITATFNVHITAVGGDIYFGSQAASSTFGVATYFNGAYNSTAAQMGASTTSFTVPSSGVVTTGINSTTAFKLAQNNSVDVPVTFIAEGRTAAGALLTTGNYAAGLEYIRWSTDDVTMQTSRFMAGKTEWRTPAVQLP